MNITKCNALVMNGNAVPHCLSLQKLFASNMETIVPCILVPEEEWDSIDEQLEQATDRLNLVTERARIALQGIKEMGDTFRVVVDTTSKLLAAGKVDDALGYLAEIRTHIAVYQAQTDHLVPA